MGCRGGAGRASFRVMGRGGQGEASGTEKEDKVDPKLALGRDVFLLRTPAAADAAGRAAPGLKQGVLDALRAAGACARGPSRRRVPAGGAPGVRVTPARPRRAGFSGACPDPEGREGRTVHQP